MRLNTHAQPNLDMRALERGGRHEFREVGIPTFDEPLPCRPVKRAGSYEVKFDTNEMNVVIFFPPPLQERE